MTLDNYVHLHVLKIKDVTFQTAADEYAVLEASKGQSNELVFKKANQLLQKVHTAC